MMPKLNENTNGMHIISHKNMPQNGGLTENYTWIRLLNKKAQLNKTLKAGLFLDRDGVVNVEKNFITHHSQLELEDGITELITYYNKRQCPVVIVTNQSGIAREKMGWADYWLIEDRLIQMLAAKGAFIDLILACSNHPCGISPYNAPDHEDRKPAPGMINKACTLLSIDPAKSVIIGDRMRDIMAGDAAGIPTGFFRRSENHDSQKEWNSPSETNFLSIINFYKIKKISQILPIIQQDESKYL